MALISAKEYLSNKGQPGSDNSDSPSSGGLISAKDYLQKYKPVPKFDPSYSMDGKPPVYSPTTDLGGTNFTPNVPVQAPPATDLSNSPTDLGTNNFQPRGLAAKSYYPPLPPIGDMRTDYPGGLWNPLNLAGRLANTPVVSTLSNSAGQAMGVPSDMMGAAKSTGNPILDKTLGFAGGTLGYLTNPAQIEQNVGNTFFNNPIAMGAGNRLGNLADSALAKLTGSNVSNTLEASLLRKSLGGAAQVGVGSAMYAPINTLNSGGDFKDIPQAMLDQGLQGAAFGAAGGLLGGAASHGLGALATKYAGTKVGDALGRFFNTSGTAPETTQPTLALPEGRGAQRFNAAMDRGNLSPNTDPVYGQGDIHTFALPEASNYLKDRYSNHAEATNDLNTIKGEISNLQDGYSQAVKDQYSYLKQSLKDRGGVSQGSLIKDATGNVTSRVGRISNNPKWYQDFYAENGRTPNNKDLADLAKQQVDQGYQSENGLVPSWKAQNNYDESLSALKQVHDELSISVDNYNPAIVGRASLPETNVGFTPKKPSIEPMKPLDKPLNVDGKQPDIIKLTPKQIAKNERADNFSRVENNPILPNTADQIQSKTGKQSIPFADRANDAYIKLVDNQHRTNQFDQVAKDANGGELKPSDSAYTLALNARGHDMQASQIVNRNLIDAKGEVVGPSLANVTSQIPKGKEAAFNDYVVAKHSIARMGRGEKVYADNKEMTIQKAQEIVKRYDKSDPTFEDVAKQYTDFHTKFAQNWYVDTGLLNQSQLDGYRQANPDYVPNKRIFSDLEKNQQYGSKGGVTGQTNPVKKADGSQRKIVSPVESSIEDVSKGVKTTKMNEAGQAIVRSLQRNPEELKGFAEIVHDQPKMDVTELLHKEGPDGLIDHINKTFEDATRKPDLDKGNVVTVLMNGAPVHIRIHDPQFLEAVSNLNPKGQDYVTNLVGKGTKVMKTLTTGVNPIFGLTRNISRDIPHAFVSSKTTSNPIRFGADLVDAMTSVLADSMSHSKITPDFMKGWLETRGSLYNDYKNMGGGHSSPISADRNLLAQSKEKILPSGGIGQTLKRNLITKPYHVLENINNAAEAAPRLGEYKRVVKQGNGTYDSKVKGLFEANDLTVNFNKYGNVTKNADAYVPYLNAAVQGLDQIARMYTQGGASRLAQVYAKSIGSLTIPTAVLYMLNHNDPNYQQVSNFIKDNYLLIPNGDGTFTKVAKPRELGMVFSTGVERALRAFSDQDPRAFQDFSNNFLQNFLPPGVGGAIQGYQQKGLAGIPGGVMQDTIAGPIMDLERNKNFANQPIVPQDLLTRSPSLQYDAKTSEPAKFLGNLLNSSPKQLDFLAKSYLGVIGQLGIPATTKGGSIGDTLKQQVTADPTFSNDISRNFYDQKTKADMAKVDAKASGIPQQQDLSAYYDRLAASFTKLRNQMKLVQNDGTISNIDKRAKLKELQDNLNQIQLKATK